LKLSELRFLQKAKLASENNQSFRRCYNLASFRPLESSLSDILVHKSSCQLK
jgi:hypothetical protein